MSKQSILQVMIVSSLLVACAGKPAGAGAQTGEPSFRILTKNPEDQVSVQSGNGTAQIDIQSPGGIGSASFELASGAMPEEITVHLHLKGLEQLRLSSAKDRISASVSTGEAATTDTESILSSGTESPLLPGHPLWMEIEIVSGQAQKMIPLEEGYFKVTLPQEFIRNAGTTFEIEWIDFYR